MSSSKAPVITVDGPSGAGKGTLCEALAKRLGWHFLDSGALYRVLALDGQQVGVALDDAEALAARARSLALRFAPGGGVWLGDQDVSLAIRSDAAGQAASQVAALPPVREALLGGSEISLRFRALWPTGGTWVRWFFPRRRLRFFLSASAPARAERRYKQLKEKGLDANLRALLESIQARDERDQARSASPLRPADDALVIDSTALAVDDVFGAVWRAALQRGLCAEG